MLSFLISLYILYDIYIHLSTVRGPHFRSSTFMFRGIPAIEQQIWVKRMKIPWDPGTNVGIAMS